MKALRRGLLRAMLAFALAPPASSASRAELYAEQITPENADTRRVGGSDAIGGLGDWALGNGTLCAVVSDPSHESVLSTGGGVLVDLGHCGRNDDEWIVLQPLVNLSRQRVLPIHEVHPELEGDAGVASLVTRGALHGLEIETRYQLGRERPDALRVTTRLRRQADATASERAFLFGDVVLHGRRQLAPFTLSLSELDARPQPVGSVGFSHPAVDVDDTLAMVRAIVPANLHVLVGGNELTPGIAYGLRLVGASLERADGTHTPLPHLAINGEDFSLLGIFTRPFWIGGSGGIGLLELAQTLLMDLDSGESLIFEREILVGERGDVASVTDQLWPDAPLVRGHTEASARIHVSARSGAAVTQARPAADGSFAFRLQEGSYELRVRAPAGREITRQLDVGAAGVDLGPLSLDAVARVVLPRGRPMRLIFYPEGGARLPEGEDRSVSLGDDLLGFRVGEKSFAGGAEANHISLAGIPQDPAEVTLAPGRYTVFATRGPEFSVTRAQLDARAGVANPLTIDSPQRVLQHPGWLGADLHVHALQSDDSSLPLAQRLASFVAAGADVIVSTEHDRIADYGPLIARLGLAGEVSSIVGAEVTSTVRGGDAPHTFGHANVFPLPFRPLEYRGGAPDGEGRRLRALIADVHALGAERLVQLNHPRAKSADLSSVSDGNFFTHLSVAGTPYRPEAPLTEPPNHALLERDPRTGVRDLDFDVIELMNGDSMEQYRASRADWYSLLLQGEFRPGVANSDSHVLTELVALPRTYVRVSTGPDGFDEQRFVRALRAGRAYGSTGPLLELKLRSDKNGSAGDSAQIGDLFASRRGTLELTVRAAAWVPVSHVTVRVDGAVLHEGPIETDVPLRLPLEFSQDAFVTVEVSGEPGPVYAAVAPSFEPFAFSNPIFVDADGDGRFSPPGLPEEPLPVLRPAGGPGAADR
jgi:hypothetical protein